MDVAEGEIPDGVTVVWHDTPERYNFNLGSIADFWDLDERQGFVQIFDVNTEWFSITRWTGLINGEIDGSESAVVERGDGDYLLVVFSNSLDGANYIRKRVDGDLVVELKNIPLAEHIMQQAGDVSYFSRGKAENIAKNYDSYQELMDAPQEEFEAVKGMSEEKARKVYDRLHE